MFFFTHTTSFDRFLWHIAMAVVAFEDRHSPLKVLLSRAYTETEGLMAVLTACSWAIVFFFAVGAGLHSVDLIISKQRSSGIFDLR